MARRNGSGRKRRRARRVNVTLAADTDEMLTEAARIEGISKAQYLREGGIMRAGFTFAEALHREEADELRERIARIEQHLGIDEPST